MRKTFIPSFGQWWAALLWRVMTITGKGYRRHSMRNTGIGKDRRKDKLESARMGISPMLRRYQSRYGA